VEKLTILATHPYLTRRQMAMVTPEEQILAENSKGINELKSSMSEMRAMRSELNSWKPEVDNRVHELEHAIADLGEWMDRALEVLRPSVGVAMVVPAGVVTVASTSTTHPEDTLPSPSAQMPDSAHLESSPLRAASRSLDHCKLGHGVVFTTAPTHHHVTGAMQTSKPNPNSFTIPDSALYAPPQTLRTKPNADQPQLAQATQRLSESWRRRQSRLWVARVRTHASPTPPFYADRCDSRRLTAISRGIAATVAIPRPQRLSAKK